MLRRDGERLGLVDLPANALRGGRKEPLPTETNHYEYLPLGQDDDIRFSFSSPTEGLATVTVEGSSDPIATEFTAPDEDIEFREEPRLTITYTLDESEDVLIDLKVDTDDDHLNGAFGRHQPSRRLSRRSLRANTHQNQDGDQRATSNGSFRVEMDLDSKSITVDDISASVRVGSCFAAPFQTSGCK